MQGVQPAVMRSLMSGIASPGKSQPAAIKTNAAAVELEAKQLRGTAVQGCSCTAFAFMACVPCCELCNVHPHTAVIPAVDVCCCCSGSSPCPSPVKSPQIGAWVPDNADMDQGASSKGEGGQQRCFCCCVQGAAGAGCCLPCPPVSQCLLSYAVVSSGSATCTQTAKADDEQLGELLQLTKWQPSFAPAAVPLHAALCCILSVGPSSVHHISALPLFCAGCWKAGSKGIKEGCAIRLR